MEGTETVVESVLIRRVASFQGSMSSIFCSGKKSKVKQKKGGGTLSFAMDEEEEDGCKWGKRDRFEEPHLPEPTTLQGHN